MSSTHSVKQASDQPPLYQNRDTLTATLSHENSVFLRVYYWILFRLDIPMPISLHERGFQNFAAVADLSVKLQLFIVFKSLNNTQQ